MLERVVDTIIFELQMILGGSKTIGVNDRFKNKTDNLLGGISIKSLKTWHVFDLLKPQYFLL